MTPQNRATRLTGIVEGFFSRPLPVWTPHERLATIRFCQKHAPGINAYLYCPKQDPYVTSQWHQHYPEREACDLKELITACRNAEMTFIFGLNPSLESDDIRDAQSQSIWFTKAEAKLAQLIALGARNLCLLFDDVPLAYDVVDRQDGADAAAEIQMVNLVNRLHDRFHKEVDEFYFCSPDYCLKEETRLTRAQRALHSDIKYIWTGNEIFAPTVSEADCARAAQIRGATAGLVWWVNYPVNDCEQACGMFNLGGFLPPAPEARPMLDSIFVNPMRECFANLPFYCTVSDYAISPSTYHREKSWQRGLATILGVEANGIAPMLIAFSARNCVDSTWGTIASFCSSDHNLHSWLVQIERALGDIARVQARDDTGARFLDTVGAVTASARWFHSIAAAIVQGTIVDHNQFDCGDIFPTTPQEARYCSEIARIVQARLTLLPSAFQQSATEDLKPLLKEVSRFESTYRGREKLTISQQEQERYRVVNEHLIKIDRDAFIAFLNDGAMPARERIARLGYRFEINRFTLKPT